MTSEIVPGKGSDVLKLNLQFTKFQNEGSEGNIGKTNFRRQFEQIENIEINQILGF